MQTIRSPRPVLAETVTSGAPAKLRQKALEHLFEFRKLFLLVAFQIPFVHRNDDRAALGLGKIGNPQVLLFERDLHVQQHDNNLGKAHGAQTVGDRQLLRFVADPRLLRIPAVSKIRVGVEPRAANRDRVTGDARLPVAVVLTDDLVDQRRFSGVRAPDDLADAAGAARSACGRLFIRFKLGLFLGQVHIDDAGVLGRTLPRTPPMGLRM